VETENGDAEELDGQYVAGETVDLLLPARVEYIPVLRAVAGVVAGALSFSYDEIIALRVAVSEAFGLALRHTRGGGPNGGSEGIKVSFVIAVGHLEVVIAAPGVKFAEGENAEDVESRAVLESLVNSVTIGDGRSGERVISLVKHRE
jgi:anti-sigma regulatory factor (Ser/Thr protein kinase)